MVAKSPDELMADYCYKPSYEENTLSIYEKKLDITPELITFGDWATSQFSTTQQFIITNNGYTSVVISRSDISSDFALAESIPESIEAGESITINVSFHPSREGLIVGVFSLEAEDAIGDHAIRFEGTGWNSIDPDISSILMDGSVTLMEFPYWDDILDEITNVILPEVFS